MPSTIELRSLLSRAVQSFRYQRSTASTCSPSSLPAPSPPCSVSVGTSSPASRSLEAIVNVKQEGTAHNTCVTWGVAQSVRTDDI